MFAELIRTEVASAVEAAAECWVQALGLVETPGGAELLGIVGYIYTQEAQQFIGGPLGVHSSSIDDPPSVLVGLL